MGEDAGRRGGRCPPNCRPPGLSRPTPGLTSSDAAPAADLALTWRTFPFSVPSSDSRCRGSAGRRGFLLPLVPGRNQSRSPACSASKGGTPNPSSLSLCHTHSAPSPHPHPSETHRLTPILSVMLLSWVTPEATLNETLLFPVVSTGHPLGAHQFP